MEWYLWSVRCGVWRGRGRVVPYARDSPQTSHQPPSNRAIMAACLTGVSRGQARINSTRSYLGSKDIARFGRAEASEMCPETVGLPPPTATPELRGAPILLPSVPEVVVFCASLVVASECRGEWIRTTDLLVPNQAL